MSGPIASRVPLRAAVAVTAALLACSVAAAPAGAATVEMRTETRYDPGTGNPKQPDDFTLYLATLEIAARDDEVNRVTFEVGEDRFAIVRDEATAVTAGPGCERVDDHAVRCATGYPRLPPPRHTFLVAFEVDLGPGDDAFTAPQTLVFGGLVAGGAGADRLTLGGSASGAREGSLRGDEGDDVLTLTGTGGLEGGLGADTLTGGPGAQTLEGGADADRIDGGEGHDVLSYHDHLVPVAIDLADGSAGAAASGDVYAGVESVLGGSGDDVLRGDAQNNTLTGGAGADRLEGRAGHDVLFGGDGDDVLGGSDGDDRLDDGPGADVADGGAGDDAFWGGGPDLGPDRGTGGPGNDRFDNVGLGDRADGGDGRDRLLLVPGLATLDAACGPGRDYIGPTSLALLVPPDCEDVFLGGLNQAEVVVRPARLRVGRARVSLRLPNLCDLEEPCRTTLRVYVGRRLVARGRRALGDGPDRVVHARVLRGRSRALRSAAVLAVRITTHAAGERYLDGGFSMAAPERSRRR